MVYSKFVAVGMNKRIIHLSHANIIEMELSGVIGVEEHGNVAGVRWRRLKGDGRSMGGGPKSTGRNKDA